MDDRIIYEKKSNNRSQRFAIETYIVEDARKKKVVKKRATYPEGKMHLDQMYIRQKYLQEMFDDSGIKVLPCERNENGVVFPYISGESLEEKLDALVEKEEYQKARTVLREYLDIIRRIHSTMIFQKTDGFREVFGEVEFDEPVMSAPFADIDLVLDNIIIHEEKMYLLDYEWTFDFPIPVDYLIYRILHYYVFRNAKSRELLEHGFMDVVPYEISDIQRFLVMEEHFQRYMGGQADTTEDHYFELRRIKEAKGLIGKVYFDFGRGYNEKQTIQYEASSNGRKLHAEFVVPLGALGFRIDPIEGITCAIDVEGITDSNQNDLSRHVKSNGVRVSNTWYFLDTTDPYLAMKKHSGKISVDYVLRRMENCDIGKDRIKYLFSSRTKQVWTKIQKLFDYKERRRKGCSMDDIEYQAWFDYNKRNEEKTKSHTMKSGELPYQPQIGLFTYMNELDIKGIKCLFESLCDQTYGSWKLYLVRGPQLRCWHGLLLTIFSLREKRVALLKTESDRNIFDYAKLCQGCDYISFVSPGDVLESDALYEIVKTLPEDGADIIYTDEDTIVQDAMDYRHPKCKPDFSIDLLRSYNYIGGLLLVKSELVREIGQCKSSYEYILRCVEKTNSIIHVPRILFHAGQKVNEDNGEKSRVDVLVSHLQRVGEQADVTEILGSNLCRVNYRIVDEPLVSIIIANKDHVDLLDRCIGSIEEKSTYRHFEIIVVENNSTEEATFAYYKQVQSRYDNVRVCYWKGDFNFAAINNYGVLQAKGEFILLLNNDTEMICPTAIEDMLANCMRDGIGAVGAKLLYDDDTVQHAGVIIGLGDFAGHAFVGQNRDATGYMNRLAVSGNWSAVTAACLMTSRELYEAVGGLTEDFAVAVNDVDYCLKLRERGYQIVYDAYAEWYHYESKSRGYENGSRKKERFRKEVDLFMERWGHIVKDGDPFYNINFQTEIPFDMKW